MNKVILCGRLGQDPEIKETASGKKLANFSLATNRWQKDAPPDWHRCVAFDKTASIIGDYVKKGSMLLVEGQIQYRSWEDQDGTKRYATEIVVNSVELLGSKDGNSGGGGSNPPVEDDDLPF